jgi:hypothetical protein
LESRRIRITLSRASPSAIVYVLIGNRSARTTVIAPSSRPSKQTKRRAKERLGQPDVPFTEVVDGRVVELANEP